MFADPTFYRSLASLHRAGIPWPQAVATAAGTDGRASGPLQSLAQGQSLAESLGPVVDPLDRAMLQAGESSGRLEATLERIAARHEQEARLRGERKAALAYPVLMGHVAALLAAVPDLIQGHVGQGLLWSLGVLVPLWTALWLTRPRRLAANPEHPGPKAPTATGLTRNAVEEADARALLALADGYESGVRLDEVLTLAHRAGAGGRVAFDLYRARPRVAEGKPLASVWSAIPETMARALTVGEDTGELGATARQQATELAFAVEMRRKKIASLLPLGIMILVGGLVAWRVIGFYVGYFQKATQY